MPSFARNIDWYPYGASNGERPRPGGTLQKIKEWWRIKYCTPKIGSNHQTLLLPWRNVFFPRYSKTKFFKAISSTKTHERSTWPDKITCCDNFGRWSDICDITPPKTWQQKITMFSRRYVFKWLFFHCHVGFRGSNFFILFLCNSESPIMRQS